ncbi:MAG TPA: histidine kinase N-terminal 7TM domain-containing protein [Anaerolineae bacterium]|nr:histidine kinase N-terminal 7TM domain-containing protein [Anaerolineae bacterium]
MDSGSLAATWPYLATLALLTVLSLYSWRQRSVPGARYFAVACLFVVVWTAGAVAELVASDPSAKIGWFIAQSAWQLPVATAMTCFVLEYVHPGRWLTRRRVVLLSIPPLLILALALSNGLHGWMWRGFSVGGTVVPVRGPAVYIGLAYSLCLVLVNIAALAWLFVRSPQHRWPAAMMLAGHVASRGLHTIDLVSAQPILAWDPFLAIVAIPFGIYAVALFGFRILDPLPAARQAAAEQMGDGMVVLDAQRRILSLNPAAESMLDSRTARARGKVLHELVPALAAVQSPEPRGRLEIGFSPGGEASHGTHHYVVEHSALKDARGLLAGYLVLLRDVTEQRQAQAQVVEQQRALAMLQERDKLARELHDGIGQVLGYVKMQAQAARDRLAQDQVAAADAALAQLAAVAQDAHTDVREYILGARTPAGAEAGFLAALQSYLERFGRQYGLQAELIAPPGWSDEALEPTVQAQLLRIVQEALTNARKHAQAHAVQVSLHLAAGGAQVNVRDDGVGFDPALLSAAEGQKYGLGFMRERAQEVGGSVEIHSAPGAGTQVLICVPRRKEGP